MRRSCAGEVRRMAALGVAAALPLLSATCGPADSDGRLTVRSVQIQATAGDGTVLRVGAVDSTWAVPGDGQGRITRSVRVRPGEAGVSSPLLDQVLDALATRLEVNPQDEPPGELSGSEARTNWLVEAPLGQGVTFRAQIPTSYVRRADRSWYGTGTLDRDLHWVVASVSPPDTVSLDLQGEFRDLRHSEGTRTASVRADGTLRVASAGGTYQVVVEESLDTSPVSSDVVRRTRERTREGLASAGVAPEP